MRTIENNLTNDWIIDAFNFDGISHKEIYEAIGFFSSWNLSYPKVALYGLSDGEIQAAYYNENGDFKYLIAAIWHGDHYGFHS